MLIKDLCFSEISQLDHYLLRSLRIEFILLELSSTEMMRKIIHNLQIFLTTIS